jgi:hypothetical protein
MSSRIREVTSAASSEMPISPSLSQMNINRPLIVLDVCILGMEEGSFGRSTFRPPQFARKTGDWQ